MLERVGIILAVTVGLQGRWSWWLGLSAVKPRHWCVTHRSPVCSSKRSEKYLVCRLVDTPEAPLDDCEWTPGCRYVITHLAFHSLTTDDIPAAPRQSTPRPVPCSVYPPHAFGLIICNASKVLKNMRSSLLMLNSQLREGAKLSQGRPDSPGPRWRRRCLTVIK